MPHAVPFIHLPPDVRRQLFHISVLVVAGPDAVRAATTTPTTSSSSANRIISSAALVDDASENGDAAQAAQLPEAQSSSRIIHGQAADEDPPQS